MNKYDQLKTLKKTKARISHICDKCGKEIKAGEIYYRESIGRVNVPSTKLKKFCSDCYKKFGDNLLK